MKKERRECRVVDEDLAEAHVLQRSHSTKIFTRIIAFKSLREGRGEGEAREPKGKGDLEEIGVASDIIFLFAA
jgi:hypothetical protein